VSRGPGRWTPEYTERVKALWVTGKTGRQIAAELGDGLTANAVIRKMWSMDVDRGGAVNRTNQVLGSALHAAVNRVAAGHLPGAAPDWFVPKQTHVYCQPRPLGSLHEGRECRYPVSGELGDTLYCCNTVVPDRPYCEGHMAACYIGWRAAA
jgi:hypothetical protein